MLCDSKCNKANSREKERGQQPMLDTHVIEKRSKPTQVAKFVFGGFFLGIGTSIVAGCLVFSRLSNHLNLGQGL